MFNVYINKGNRILKNKFVSLKVDKNFIYFFNNNEDKNIYKIIPLTKLKNLSF